MTLRTRPPVQQDRIVEFIRDRIIDGRFPPGMRLPGRLELERKFHVSYVTVQRAFDRLVADGFVEVRSRLGTYVAQRPAHRYRYGLAFPHWRTHAAWVRYWTVLLQVVDDFNRRGPGRIDVFEGVDKHRDDQSGVLALLSEVAALRIAGVVYLTGEHAIAGTPLLNPLDQPGVPGVLVSGSRPQHPRLANVHMEDTFVGRAVDELVARGRRRLAMITQPGEAVRNFPRLTTQLATHGLEAEAYLLQVADQTYRAGAGRVADLLCRLPPEQRPDGLIITDDNLAPFAAGGIVAAGLSIPTDMDVVAHANFPSPPLEETGILRLGYDIRRILDGSIRAIDTQRAGEVPDVTRIPVQFEWELDP